MHTGRVFVLDRSDFTSSEYAVIDHRYDGAVPDREELDWTFTFVVDSHSGNKFILNVNIQGVYTGEYAPSGMRLFSREPILIEYDSSIHKITGITNPEINGRVADVLERHLKSHLEIHQPRRMRQVGY